MVVGQLNMTTCSTVPDQLGTTSHNVQGHVALFKSFIMTLVTQLIISTFIIIRVNHDCVCNAAVAT